MGRSPEIDKIIKNQNELFEMYSESQALQNRIQNSVNRLQDPNFNRPAFTYDTDSIADIVEYLQDRTGEISNPDSTEIVNPTMHELEQMRESMQRSRTQDEDLRTFLENL